MLSTHNFGGSRPRDHYRFGGRPSRWGAALLLLLLAKMFAPAGTGAALRAAPEADAPEAAEAPPEAGAPAEADGGPDVERWMERQLAALADPDPAVRDKAQFDLMGMPRRHLETFEQVVRRNVPLAPSQKAPLRRIVTHVYLSGHPYNTYGHNGWIGISMQDLEYVSQAGAPGAAPADPFQLPDRGIMVDRSFPGFPGARGLRDGDIVVGLAEPLGTRFRNKEHLRSIIDAFTPGDAFDLVVLRQGRHVRVPLSLAPRPAVVDTGSVENLLRDRKRAAHDYWKKSFAPLVAQKKKVEQLGASQ